MESLRVGNGEVRLHARPYLKKSLGVIGPEKQATSLLQLCVARVDRYWHREKGMANGRLNWANARMIRTQALHLSATEVYLPGWTSLWSS